MSGKHQFNVRIKVLSGQRPDDVVTDNQTLKQGANMKKIFTTILHFALIGMAIHFSGCKTQEYTQRVAPNDHILNAKENIKRAKKSEQNKNLAEALYFYKAAADIYEKKKRI
ncbi:hypothetical protein QUF75_19695 [Desulfococcaceae bacterium HSG7]|nr:hypothetical protein [Desulfococcaceae bacterium HSG7]